MSLVGSFGRTIGIQSECLSVWWQRSLVMVFGLLFGRLLVGLYRSWSSYWLLKGLKTETKVKSWSLSVYTKRFVSVSCGVKINRGDIEGVQSRGLVPYRLQRGKRVMYIHPKGWGVWRKFRDGFMFTDTDWGCGMIRVLFIGKEQE